MDSCPTQAVLPLVGLAAEKVIRDQYKSEGAATGQPLGTSEECRGGGRVRDARRAMRVPGDPAS
ncbi:MAG: hypothetical protein R6U98_34155 [Pirellulaceae bacterium]